MHKQPRVVLVFSLLLFIATALSNQAQLLWTVGLDDNGWPQTGGGGPDASFVQENGVINPLPGDPLSPAVDTQADNDYYFSGLYNTAIQSVIDFYGSYDPVGPVTDDEVAAERAFAAADDDLRYHFNLPETLKTNDLLSVTFDALNLDTGDGSDPRYGIEVYFNGVLVQPQIVIRPAQIDQDFTTPQFTLASVNAQVGPGFDNIVSLKGINYNADGGGNWMGIDYVQLNHDTNVAPAAKFPWQVGSDDNKHITSGSGGGTNTAFVQESGNTNALPGSAKSPQVDKQADDDYYFAGSYTTNIPSVVAFYGAYQTIGLVATNEESAERAFATGDNERRYHFNLPSSISPSDRLAVTMDPLNLDATATDPHYGVEIYVNGVKVQSEVVVRPGQLNKPITTAAFSASSVNAQTGPGFDNIVTLRGISHSSEGGGNSMGIDYVRLDREVPPPALPWFVGQNDNGQRGDLSGGGANAAFVQESGTTNALPGNPNSPKINQQADDDYYFAGIYTAVIPGNGNYTPVGILSANEEAAERAFAGDDNYLRYHFNLPANLQPTDKLTVGFDALSLDTPSDVNTDVRYGIEVYFNNVLVQTQLVIRVDQLNKPIFTPPFTVASVNGQPGPGYDNIVTLKGINYNADGGGNWMGFDFIELTPIQSSPFPWAVGKDDNSHILAATLGGPDTAFVQENGGSNVLPGDPYSPDVDQQADDDYYFAGTYTNVIQSVVDADGDYTPVGAVFSNEAAAERAFAGSDNTKRYHFNLPSSLKPTDQLLVVVDFNNLDTSGGDPQYGFEVYFNEVLVQPEIVVHSADLDTDYTTPPFTLASVNAQVGPGFDNIVTLKGINHNDIGGGQWMGIDYLQLNPMPTPVFPWAVGKDDNDWPAGDGGGPNTTFVQENGTINDLPGSAFNHEIPGQADNDYYFAGVYTNTVPGIVTEYGDYTPVGFVPRNEEAAERAFAGSDNDLRYHFNLPSTLSLTNKATITFDSLNLDTSGTDPQYGIAIYFNGVKLQDEIILRTNDLNVAHTTAPFTLASVNAKLGLGYDNIVSLQGVNHSDVGGGNWMGFDYVQLNAAGTSNPPPIFLATTMAAGKITLNWTGTGNLESAPAITGPWTPVTPAPVPPYSENIVSAQNRFYRLKQP